MAYDFAVPDGTTDANGQVTANSSDMPLNSADVAAIQAQLNQLK
jgi:hypothetical protein